MPQSNEIRHDKVILTNRIFFNYFNIFSFRIKIKKFWYFLEEMFERSLAGWNSQGLILNLREIENIIDEIDQKFTINQSSLQMFFHLGDRIFLHGHIDQSNFIIKRSAKIMGDHSKHIVLIFVYFSQFNGFLAQSDVIDKNQNINFFFKLNLNYIQFQRQLAVARILDFCIELRCLSIQTKATPMSTTGTDMIIG